MAAQGSRLSLTRILVWSGLFCVIGGAAIVMGSLITTDFDDPEQAGKFLTQTSVLEELEPESNCHAESDCLGTESPATVKSFEYTPLALAVEMNPGTCVAESSCGKEHACPLSKLASTDLADTKPAELPEKSAREIIRELTEGGPVSEELKPLVDDEIVLGSASEIPSANEPITKSRERLWDRNDPPATEEASDKQRTTIGVCEIVPVSDPKTYKPFSLNPVRLVQDLLPGIEGAISFCSRKIPTMVAEVSTEKESPLTRAVPYDSLNQTAPSPIEKNCNFMNACIIGVDSANREPQDHNEKTGGVFGRLLIESGPVNSMSPMTIFSIQSAGGLQGLRSLGYGILINDLDQRISQTEKIISSQENPLLRQSEPNFYFQTRGEGAFLGSVLKAAFESEKESENSPSPISPAAESVPAGCPKAMHLRRAADELDKAGMADKAADLRKQADDVQAAFEAEEMRNRPVQVTGGQVEELKKTLAELREEVKQLKATIEGLKGQFGIGLNEPTPRTPLGRINPVPLDRTFPSNKDEFIKELEGEELPFPPDSPSLEEFFSQEGDPLTSPAK